MINKYSNIAMTTRLASPLACQSGTLTSPSTLNTVRTS